MICHLQARDSGKVSDAIQSESEYQAMKVFNDLNLNPKIARQEKLL